MGAGEPVSSAWNEADLLNNLRARCIDPDEVSVSAFSGAFGTLSRRSVTDSEQRVLVMSVLFVPE